MAEPASASLFRAVVTVCGAAIASALTLVPLPGVEPFYGGMEEEAYRPSLFALGIAPVVSGMILVEIAASIVPSWRRLRHAGAEGHAKLSRASLRVALLVAAFEGWALVQAATVARAEPVVWIAIPSLTAGVVVLLFIAQAITRRGLASGLGILSLTGMATDSVGPLRGWRGHTPLDASLVLGGVLGVSALVAVTWATTLPTRGPAAPPAPPTRAPFRHTEPASEARLLDASPVSGAEPIGTSILAVLFGLVLLGASPSRFLTEGGLVVLLQAGPIVLLALLVAALLAVFAWSYAFNRPGHIAALWSQATGEPVPPIATQLRAELRITIARSALFIVAIFLITKALFDSAQLYVEPVFVILACVVGTDLFTEARARRAHPDLVEVWQDHRPYAMALARRALAHAGIPVHVRDEHQRRILQFFGPHVPLVLHVPAASAEAARALLTSLLHADRPADASHRREPVIEPPRWTTVAQWPDRIAIAVPLAVIMAALVFALVPTG